MHSFKNLVFFIYLNWSLCFFFFLIGLSPLFILLLHLGPSLQPQNTAVYSPERKGERKANFFCTGTDFCFFHSAHNPPLLSTWFSFFFFNAVALGFREIEEEIWKGSKEASCFSMKPHAQTITYKAHKIYCHSTSAKFFCFSQLSYPSKILQSNPPI